MAEWNYATNYKAMNMKQRTNIIIICRWYLQQVETEGRWGEESKRWRAEWDLGGNRFGVFVSAFTGIAFQFQQIRNDEMNLKKKKTIQNSGSNTRKARSKTTFFKSGIFFPSKSEKGKCHLCLLPHFVVIVAKLS